MHVVISTYNADPDQLLPWIWHLGLTNAAVYVYYRVKEPAVRAMYKDVRLPCNMSLILRRLLPNKGREAAVFLTHIVRHYERLPLALMLAHDHGPASRHSLCGPFYRRARGYYRGLTLRFSMPEPDSSTTGPGAGAEVDGQSERRGLAARGVRNSGEGNGVESSDDEGTSPVAGGRRETQLGGAQRLLFMRFASMVVTLSSGCIENWAKGCCSLLICSSSTTACPFRDANCTRMDRSRRDPGGLRQVFLHQNGRYDARVENQVVDPSDRSYKPLALLRYTSAAHRTTEMWNISHEYPPGAERVSKERTLEMLRGLLNRYNFTERKRSDFKSCCASLILRADHVRRWPVELYKDLLQYSMDPSLDYEATKAVSGPGWALWLDRDYKPNDVLQYLRVDNQLKGIQGCPAQSSPHLADLLDDIHRKRAQAEVQAQARAKAEENGEEEE